MVSISVVRPYSRPQAAQSIIVGGLLAGLLDGLDAIVFYGATVGATAPRIFQYIAGGLLGPNSYQGGWRTVALGIAFHFAIATGAATIYYFASLRLVRLVEKPFLFGSIFGLIMYLSMYYVIVPLSAVPKSTQPFSVLELANELMAHIFFVGIPIALATTWSARSRYSRDDQLG